MSPNPNSNHPRPIVCFAPAGSRLLRARDWQDRPEFEDLCEWWRAGGAGVCALIGIGGAGKTVIALDRDLTFSGASERATTPWKGQLVDVGKNGRRVACGVLV